MINATTWFLAASLALATCGNAADRMPAPPTAKTDSWTVDVRTSGGFDGIGRGTVTISSDGKVAVDMPIRPGEKPRRCESKLSASDLAALRAATDGAAPSEWAGRTIGFAAADAITYTLELKSDGATATVTWYDNTRENLPAGLARLYDVIDGVWTKAADACRPKQGSGARYQGSGKEGI
jgi:hypothetical protein